LAYTEDDLTSIESAIVKLAGGSRIVEVTIEGKSVKYGQADLSELRNLAGYIRRKLGNSGLPKIFRTVTGPGL
jgi:hypothetical protein